jgi:hypothetical protein
MRKQVSVSVSALLLLSSVAGASSVINFDTSPVLGAQAPGVWYTDRYAPAGFASAANPNAALGPAAAGTGANSLKIDVSPADGFGSRPPGFDFTFYATQGRKLNTPEVVVGWSVSAKLFVNEAWLGSNAETARTDLWATAQDGSSAVTAYPIIGFTNFGGAARYRYWTGAAWTDLGASVSAGWNEVGFTLVSATQVKYTLNGADVGTIVIDPTVGLGNVMLQGYNFYGNDPALAGATPAANGTSYYWDDLAFSSPGVIPLPSAALGGVALMGLSALGRRR